jgi:triphosphoribosyl-dephospho-CoA synthase
MRITTALLPDAPRDALDVSGAIGRLAALALVRELELTPKPGLVDRANSGSHRDMDCRTFQASIEAVAPWFPLFFQRGVEACEQAPAVFLRHLRVDGVDCERAMFNATAGVNTHKGSVFSFGLLCAAAGRLHGRGEVIDRDAVCTEVAQLCDGLVQKELVDPAAARTVGEQLYWTHGLTGARGEAQNGFITARTHGVAPYLLARANAATDEQALFEALLHLMANNQDTNLVSRGGLEGLDFVQAEARRLLASPVPLLRHRKAQLATLDQALIARNLSPGGSADLLAVSWFLANLE